MAASNRVRGGRQARRNFFKRPQVGGKLTFSPSLIRCAFALLEAALAQRGKGGYATATNHFTDYAAGTIVLVVAAFEAALSEFVCHFSFFHEDADTVRDLALQDLPNKYARVCELLGAPCPVGDDFTLLMQVRQEIEHYLPTGNVDPGVPPWLHELNTRGLFIASEPEVGVDFDLPTKLCSYALAYWAWDTLYRCGTEIAAAVTGPTQPVAQTVFGNFAQFQHCARPGQLPPVKEMFSDARGET